MACITTWEKKRTTTSVVYGFDVFVSSIEYSISLATSWLYLKDVVKDNENINMYYGLLHVAFFLPSILFVNVIAHYGDKYRRIKLSILIANFITLAGCILYVIPDSPLFLLIGRFFQGFNLTIRSLMYGELARSYRKEGFARMVLIFRGAAMFGKASGPVFILAFLNTDFYIGRIRIHYANISAVIIFTFVVMVQIAIYVFVYDLSREIDLKEEEKKLIYSNKNATLKVAESQKSVKVQENENSDNESDHFKKSYLTTYNDEPTKTSFQLFTKVWTDVELTLCMASMFFEEILSTAIALMIPVIILEYLHYSTYVVNLVVGLQFICFVALISMLFFVKLTQINNAMLGWTLYIIVPIIILTISNALSYSVNVILLVAVSALIEVTMLKLRVFCSTSVAFLVQSKHQSFVDSIRFQVAFLGAIVGSCVASYGVKYLKEVLVLFMIISSLLLLWIIIRRKAFVNLQIRI